MIGDKLIITATFCSLVCNQGSHCAVVAMWSAIVPTVHACIWHISYNMGAKVDFISWSTYSI